MLSHRNIWAAIDALAERHSLSPSGLAKKAGLDATAFNRSKRNSSDGRPRWPTTESIAKIIEATDETLDSFMAMVEGKDIKSRASARQTRGVPLIGFAQAGTGGYFTDAGFPAGEGWEEIYLPGTVEEGAYALQVQGESMLPLYRDGDILVVDPTVNVRKGDRVVVKTLEGEVMAKILLRRNQREVELLSLNSEHENRVFPASKIEWMARIVWASQ